MIRMILFFLAVLGMGLLFAWVADRPGTVVVDWMETQYEVSLMVALSLLVALITVILLIWGIVRGIIRSPMLVSRFFANRRRDRGYSALSKGLIAASSGDIDMAKSLARESGKLLKDEPLVQLLGTQTALLEGKREQAKINFQAMLEDDTTKLVALRGLFLEAERRGENAAAREYASEAARQSPSLPWAGLAKLRYLAIDESWDEALQTLETNRAAGLVEKEKARRQRAVLLTAKAMAEEPANPDLAVKLAKEAHKLAKDFVPAATVYAQAASRLGDIRGATKIIETTWKLQPHPDLAEAFSNVRAGDSVKDRLKRARRLADLNKNHPEGNFAVVNAAIDAKDWTAAREAIEPILTTHPTERACLLMADIEEGEHGDKGRMRDWLSRAVRAPADATWTADGQTSDEWFPVSPVTGEIDAFEWKVPLERLGGDEMIITLEDLQSVPQAEASEEEAAGNVEETVFNEADVEDAVEIVDVDETEKTDQPEVTPEPEEVTQVQFPLDRRPDDPGVRTEKE